MWSLLPKRFPVYSDTLDEAGYFVGHTGKVTDAFVGHADSAPTFLEAAYLKPPPTVG